MNVTRRNLYLCVVIVLTVSTFQGKALAANSNNKCWNLVSVKSDWKQRVSWGKYKKVSPRNIRSHLSTDGSWQWVEYIDASHPNGRIFINAGWSPPPGSYCVGSKFNTSMKLSNKAINSKNKNIVGRIAWGPDHIYGYKQVNISIAGNKAGETAKGKVGMHGGQDSLKKPATWVASVEMGNMIGKISYHYLPMIAKSPSKQTSGSSSSATANKGNAVAKIQANNDGFIRSLYFSILDRNPDAGGVNHWKRQLSYGKSRQWVITQFFKSREYLNRRKSHREYVRDLYQGILGRQPDSGGLSHWVNRLKRGSSRQAVLNGFLNSKEYRMRTGKK